MVASRGDWKNQPMPATRRAITLSRVYSPEEFVRIKEGLVPEDMEDKWFFFFEEPWLYCHRSWTGYCIWQVRFEQSDAGARTAEVLANREPKEYSEDDDISDSMLLAVLLDGRAGRETKHAWEEYMKRLETKPRQ